MEHKENNFDLLLLKNQVCFPTYAVANKIIRRYQPLLKQINLTYTQYIVMMVMWEKEIVNEKDLVNSLYLKANTLTDLIKILKKKGYIDTEKSLEDKRNLVIRLTDDGRKLKEKAVEIPKTLAEEKWLNFEEFMTYKKLLYKLLEGDWEK